MCVSKKKAIETAAIAKEITSIFTHAAKHSKPCPSDDMLTSKVSKRLGQEVTKRQVEYSVRRLRRENVIDTCKGKGGGYRSVYIVNLDLWTGRSENKRKYPARQTYNREDYPKRTQTPRTCLSCGKTFKSPHPVAINRICETCARRAMFSSGQDMQVAI